MRVYLEVSLQGACVEYRPERLPSPNGNRTNNTLVALFVVTVILGCYGLQSKVARTTGACWNNVSSNDVFAQHKIMYLRQSNFSVLWRQSTDFRRVLKLAWFMNKSFSVLLIGSRRSASANL